MVKRPLGLSASTNKNKKKSIKMSTSFSPNLTNSLPSTSTSLNQSTVTIPLKIQAQGEVLRQGQEEVKRTYPLDSDLLTLIDLFELKSSSNELINLSKGEKSIESDEELMNLLRGILHGINSLELILSSAGTSKQEREGEIESSSLLALGLSTPLASTQLLYLQAFSLFHLSSLIIPPPSALPLSLDPSGSHSSKKQKKQIISVANTKEPIDPIEWLLLSAEKYEEALITLEAVVLPSTVEGDKEKTEEEKEKDKLNLILIAGLMNVNCSLSERTFRSIPSTSTTSAPSTSTSTLSPQETSPQLTLALSYLSKIESSLPSLISLLVKTSSSTEPELELPSSAFEEAEEEVEEDSTSILILPPSEASLEVLNSLSSYISLLDSYPLTGSLSERSKLLKAIGPILLLVEDEVLEMALMVTAELVLARFIVEEEILEVTFRGDEGENENEGGEGEVIDLPDVESVRECRNLGLNVIETLKITIQINLMKPEQDFHILLKQYQSLQETYELYSCLINSKDLINLNSNSLELEEVNEKIRELLEVLEDDEEDEDEDEDDEDEDDDGEEEEEEGK